ncbi:MAG: lipoate--protein ligase [Bacteroidales bacterium]|nr:lipoate--protein ligase [Bacteroidales bacterium]
MILIERSQTDPYFNIAAEEYILKNTSGDILMFWKNAPSVVVGKHQNTLKEVNIDYVNKNQIPVIRRISGGGTVYHDEGNINYTLILESEHRETLINFKEFTKPTIEFLSTLGIEARFEGKNNLTINGKKFSGNSAHLFKNRVIHHGTLLFDSNLDILENIINHQTEGISDKAIDSIRATVTNVSQRLKKKISIDEFGSLMKSFFIDYFQIKNKRRLSVNEINEITQLAEEKYKTWKWNYGYSPKYSFKRELLIPQGLLCIEVQIKNGIIETAIISIDEVKRSDIETLITGKVHDKKELEKILNEEIPVGAFFPVSAPDQDSLD